MLGTTKTGGIKYPPVYTAVLTYTERSVNPMKKRKTRDCWRFFVDYGSGWEYETTGYTLQDMKRNRRAYQENCSYPLMIKRGRDRIENETEIGQEVPQWNG
jgi:hypothetical protein